MAKRKITNDDVVEMKKMRFDGCDLKTISLKFTEISISSIIKICNGSKYKDVAPELTVRYFKQFQDRIKRTPELIKEIIELREKGKERKEIADELRISFSSVKSILFENGINKKRKITNDAVVEIKKMRKEGNKIDDILEKFPMVSRDHLYKICNGSKYKDVAPDLTVIYSNAHKGRPKKLTNENIFEIKNLKLNGVSVDEIAKRYNVSESSIKRIRIEKNETIKVSKPKGKKAKITRVKKTTTVKIVRPQINAPKENTFMEDRQILKSIAKRYNVDVERVDIIRDAYKAGLSIDALVRQMKFSESTIKGILFN